MSDKAEYQSAWRKKRRQLGLCKNCALPVSKTNKTYCERHRLAYIASLKTYRTKRRPPWPGRRRFKVEKVKKVLLSLPIEGIDDAQIQKFMAKVDVSKGCWLWRGRIDKAGYGCMSFQGRTLKAHRFSFAAFNGPLVPILAIHHVCYVRSCVNPSHLKQVTRRENTLDSDSGSPSAVNKRKTHCPKGHPFSGDNLTLKNTGYRECRTCAIDRWRAYRARKTAKKAKWREGAKV